MISGRCRIDGRRVAYAGVSDPGLVRRCNEDSLLLLPEAGFFAVADGLGGLDAGDLASSMTLDLVRERVAACPAPVLSSRWSSRLGLRKKGPCLENMIREINRRLFEERIARHKNMASTLVLAHLDQQEIVVGHVGDSRLYRRRDNALLRLTADHSLVEELQRQGVMTADQARQSPQKHVITRAIGAEPTVNPTVASFPLRAGDVYCLCTDGLTGMLDDGAIHACLRENPDPDHCIQMANSLVACANAAGGRDNVTVVVLSVT